jgi:hypothetical protein
VRLTGTTNANRLEYLIQAAPGSVPVLETPATGREIVTPGTPFEIEVPVANGDWRVDARAVAVDMAGAGPTLITAPAITGSLEVDSTLTFDVGVWDGATSFEIEIVSTSPTDTLLARQPADGATTGSITTVVGSSLVLRVWATSVGGTTYAESAAFGPIEAAGDVWIGGFVISPDILHDPTPIGSTNTYTLLAPNPAGNPYAAPPGYGWNVASEANFSGVSRGDPRLNGRVGENSQLGVRVDLPEAGVYLVYVGVGSSNTAVSGRFVIRDGVNSVAPLLHEVITGTVNTTSTADANGIITTSADWTAASQYGGTPVEVTITGTAIWIGRPATSGTSHLNCFTILKKAL